MDGPQKVRRTWLLSVNPLHQIKSMCAMSLNPTTHKCIWMGTRSKKGGHFACKSPFQHKNIVNETSVTIGTKLWAKGSFDDEEERFISKLFANKTQSPKEWKEYFITESNQATKWLIRLGLSQYTAVFKEHEYETMHHLIQL
eukprot:471218_1